MPFYNLIRSSALASFLFGGLIFYIGWNSLRGLPLDWFAKRLSGANQTLSLLMLKDKALPAFLFGFFTVALPCGQTLLVFSACALTGDAWIGFGNGLALALFTSPALFFAMHAHVLFRNLKQYYNQVVGISGIVIGLLAVPRLRRNGTHPASCAQPRIPFGLVLRTLCLCSSFFFQEKARLDIAYSRGIEKQSYLEPNLRLLTPDSDSLQIAYSQ